MRTVLTIQLVGIEVCNYGRGRNSNGIGIKCSYDIDGAVRSDTQSNGGCVSIVERK
jgi:hypothetical protein